MLESLQTVFVNVNMVSFLIQQQVNAIVPHIYILIKLLVYVLLVIVAAKFVLDQNLINVHTAVKRTILLAQILANAYVLMDSIRMDYILIRLSMVFAQNAIGLVRHVQVLVQENA